MNGRPSSSAVGLGFALLAFSTWGIFPIYWKLFGAVPPIEVVCHRLIWSFPVLLLLTAVFRQFGELATVLRHGRRIAVLFATASLLSLNWGSFIYGVSTGQVVQGSLGYFLTPLFSVFLAFVFLQERLTRWQTVSVVLASTGVFFYGWHLGQIPWIAILIAVSFGLYGLLRKIAAVPPLPGLLIETALLFPLALGYLIFKGQGRTAADSGPGWLFVSAGLVTTLPLLWFNNAAKRLRLSTLGFLNYLTPTIHLLLGVWIFHERFTVREAFCFGLIWVAIAIYLGSLLRQQQTSHPAS